MQQEIVDGPVAASIRRKLNEAFAPVRLEIIDDSWRHAGHHHGGGIDARPGGESHFSLVIASEALNAMNRVARQRAVNTVLSEELAGPVHALSVRFDAP